MKALLIIAGLAAGIASSGCHPDPACAPGAASKREAACLAKALHACGTEQGEAYKRCIDTHDNYCDLEAEQAAARCQK